MFWREGGDFVVLYFSAIEYHMRHLNIARQLKDRVGQARAAWSLGNAYKALGDDPKAFYFALVHLKLSREVMRGRKEG